MYNEKEMRDLMKKSELLSPAGSFESAIAAIQNGCDALYLGGMRFGARAFANNFDESQLQEVIRYAHAYGVRVYITLNTLIYDKEWKDACEYIDMLYNNQVDALIIQDLGILSYVRTQYPDFEVHASTQMHISNESALQFLKKIGVKRAVLARETSIEEIARWQDIGIELEVFVHGALCVSYSGQCLMSYMVGGRSGNRGACAQSCRMPYTLCDLSTNKVYGKPAYLLSLKDLNTLEHIKTLQAAGVDSFKIEGRMKKSEYVGYITSLYRQAIDQEQFKLKESSLEKAKILFHRGYTDGFLFQQKGSKLYNPYRPNHIGITIGKVISNSKTRIKVLLKETLYQGDGVRILQEGEDYGFKVNLLYVNGLLANKAESGSTVEIECHEKIQEGSVLLKTSDPILEKEIRDDYEKIKRRINIKMEFYASANQAMKLIVSDGISIIEKRSEDIVEIAKTRVAQKSDVFDKLNKVNDTIFKVEKMDIHLEGELFISIKALNQLRRDALNELYEKRANSLERNHVAYQSPLLKPIQPQSLISVKVNKEEQLKAALATEIDCIYVQDRDLFDRYKDERIHLCSGRVEKRGYDNVTMIQDIGGLDALDEFECDTALNVCNINSALFLLTQGAKRVCLSWEMHQEDSFAMADELKEKHQLIGVLQHVVYGRCEVMVSEHCPINASILDNDKKNCALCRKRTFALKDKFNNHYPMDNDQDCRMHLYDYKVIDQIDKIEEYLKHNIAVRLDFTFESKEEVKEYIETVLR